MNLRLLIDEDSQDRRLVKLLREAGHEVITANEASLMGQPDSVVFNYASNNNYVLLTLNCRDFEALHEANLNHPGVLAVYKDADPSKDMSFQEIVKAITNLESANISLVNQFIALNHWNY